MVSKFKESDEFIEKLSKVVDFNSLGELININPFLLKRTYYGVARRGEHYNQFLIKKRSGGERTILAPDEKLKFIQRRLVYILSKIYIGKPSVHGFRINKSIITNAENHFRKRIILNIDLKDFFPTIHFGRVRGLLESPRYGLSRKSATIIAGFCCYKGKLPQGAPTSPIISNMICSGLDRDLQLLAKEEKATYSRYADDITFSTSMYNFSDNIVKTTEKGVEIGSDLENIITKNGFIINDKKTRIRFRTERQEVTGLVVNRFPNVKRSLIKEVRMMLHIWKKFGDKARISNPENNEILIFRKTNNFFNILRGKIEFIRLVKTEKDGTYQSLAKKFNDLSEKIVFRIPDTKLLEEEYIKIGQRTKAISVLKRVFATAKEDIFILDPYLAGDIINLLENDVLSKNHLMNIRLLISDQNNKKYVQCVNALKKLIKLHPEFNIECRNGLPDKIHGIHARFIIIDNEDVYQSGQSLAELGGNKADTIHRFEKRSVKNEILMDSHYVFESVTKIDLDN